MRSARRRAGCYTVSPNMPTSMPHRLPFLLLSTLAVALPCQGTVDVNLTAAPGTVNLGPGYTAEPGWFYGGTLPGQLIRATQGQTLRVRLHNQLPESTTVHFHGQPVDVGREEIAHRAEHDVQILVHPRRSRRRGGALLDAAPETREEADVVVELALRRPLGGRADDDAALRGPLRLDDLAQAVALGRILDAA